MTYAPAWTSPETPGSVPMSGYGGGAATPGESWARTLTAGAAVVQVVALDELSRVTAPLWDSVRQLEAAGTFLASVSASTPSDRAEVSRLRRQARSLARGHSGLVVELERLVLDLTAQDRGGLALLVVSAFEGDRHALTTWTARAQSGDTLARTVLALLSRLDSLRSIAVQVLDGTVRVVSRSRLTPIADDAAHTPRRSLAGSRDTTAPPRALCAVGSASTSTPPEGARPSET